MSVQQAQVFIERMKSDKEFSRCILNAENVKDRIAIAKNEGFDCCKKDIETLQAACIAPQSQNGNLPLSWQAMGPCNNICRGIAV
jgi:predicted ribosomally synthesized peptide with nif11-like leader